MLVQINDLLCGHNMDLELVFKVVELLINTVTVVHHK